MPKRPRLVAAIAAVAATDALGLAPAGPPQSSPGSAVRVQTLAPVQDYLAGHLDTLLSAEEELPPTPAADPT